MNFLKKNFSLFCIIFSLILLVYILYKSEIYWNGEKRKYYLNYYILVICFGFLSFLTVFLNEKIKEYLIISIISLLSSLYLFEGYLIYSNQYDFKKKKLYEFDGKKKYDTRSKNEIFKDLKILNSKIKLNVSPASYINTNKSFYPFSGISQTKTIFCNENGYYSIYESDRYGFNNPDSEWDKNEIEYLLVGDSFTHGACVNRPNDIASVLRVLSNKSVLNLGFSGNGPLIEYATLREYLNPNVKKILWIYFEGNDLRTNLDKELSNKILHTYLDNLSFSQNLKENQKKIDNYVNELIDKEIKLAEEREKFFNNFVSFIKLYQIRNIFKSKQKVMAKKKIQPEFKKIIKLAKDLANKNKSKFYFIYLPEHARFNSNYDDSSYRSIKEFIIENNIPFISLYDEIFIKEKNPLKFIPFEKIDGHYNVEGYKIIAETINNLTN